MNNRFNGLLAIAVTLCTLTVVPDVSAQPARSFILPRLSLKTTTTASLMRAKDYSKLLQPELRIPNLLGRGGGLPHPEFDALARLNGTERPSALATRSRLFDGGSLSLPDSQFPHFAERNHPLVAPTNSALLMRPDQGSLHRVAQQTGIDRGSMLYLRLDPSTENAYVVTPSEGDDVRYPSMEQVIQQSSSSERLTIVCHGADEVDVEKFRTSARLASQRLGKPTPVIVGGRAEDHVSVLREEMTDQAAIAQAFTSAETQSANGMYFREIELETERGEHMSMRIWGKTRDGLQRVIAAVLDFVAQQPMLRTSVAAMSTSFRDYLDSRRFIVARSLISYHADDMPTPEIVLVQPIVARDAS